MDVGLVCDACSALTPIGVPQCTRCGSPVALDPRPKGKSKPPPMIEALAHCAKCDADIQPGQRFCPNCGARVVAPPSFDDRVLLHRHGDLGRVAVGHVVTV